MYVAKCWDELWVEVKFQPHPEIAGSPRNALRCSLKGEERREGSEWARGRKLTEPNQTSNAVLSMPWE